MPTQRLPLVTIIIPMRNEEGYIGPCLDSLLQLDYPPDRLEVLVVDGASTDRSGEIVGSYSEKFRSLRLLDNPKRTAPSAMNVGLREARGTVIVRMDAHSLYEPDYVTQCVHLLQTTDAANVGGPQRAQGDSYISSAIAVATTQPFGAGDARFRISEKREWVDTVYLGAWWKATLDKIGGFDESWVVNQDYELNQRLRKAGGRILLAPEIRCTYFVRGSLRKLARQYFRYGCWRVKTIRAHPESWRWRQLIPPAFVLALAGSFALLPFAPWAGMALPATYALADLAFSVRAAAGRWHLVPGLLAVFPTLHLAYGAGFLVGIFRFGIRSRRSAPSGSATS